MALSTPGRNTWTEEQRIVLRLLNAEFNINTAARAQIFNYVFHDHLKACGISQGLTAGVLGSQYSEHTRERRSQQWANVLRTPATDIEREKRRRLVERIREAATALGVHLDDSLRRAVSTENENSSAHPGSHNTITANGWRGYAVATVEEAQLLVETQKKNMFGFTKSPLEMKSRNRAAKAQVLTKTLFSPIDVAVQKRVRDTTSIDMGKEVQPSEDSEMEDEEGETEDQDVEEPGTEKSAAANRPLEMLHRSGVDWEGGPPSVESFDDTLIEHSCAVYQHGGDVHRIMTFDGQEADFMICDPKSCAVCDPHANTVRDGGTDGLPFVHSSDTVRDSGLTYFKPKPRNNVGSAQQGFFRWINFQGLDGAVWGWSRICGHVGCVVCSGSEMQTGEENEDKGPPDGKNGGAEKQVKGRN